MKITVEKTTPDWLVKRACEATLRPGMTSKASFAKMLRCEHSPIRTQWYWVEIEGCPSFVSVHFVRHHMGVDPFVTSNRDDRGGAGDAVVTRETPVLHTCHINAQAVITMSRKRLCLKSHRRTVATWTKLRRAMAEVEPDLSERMVPECVYRNGLCPEMTMCAAGVDRVCGAYPAWPGYRAGELP